MKAYQKYIKEHQDDIQELLLHFLYILERTEEYEDFDYANTTYFSDKLKSITKNEYATLCSAVRSLDIMTRHDIEITTDIAKEIAYSVSYCASYMPVGDRYIYAPLDQNAEEFWYYLQDVSKNILEKTRKACMRERRFDES